MGRRADDIRVVLDSDDGVALVDERWSAARRSPTSRAWAVVGSSRMGR
jgi:hypothetical protein